MALWVVLAEKSMERLRMAKNVKMCLMLIMMTLKEGIQRRFARPVTDATMEACF